MTSTFRTLWALFKSNILHNLHHITETGSLVPVMVWRSCLSGVGAPWSPKGRAWYWQRPPEADAVRVLSCSRTLELRPLSAAACFCYSGWVSVGVKNLLDSVNTLITKLHSSSFCFHLMNNSICTRFLSSFFSPRLALNVNVVEGDARAELTGPNLFVLLCVAQVQTGD